MPSLKTNDLSKKDFKDEWVRVAVFGNGKRNFYNLVIVYSEAGQKEKEKIFKKDSTFKGFLGKWIKSSDLTIDF